MSEEKWFYAENGEPVGPVGFDVLVARARQGTLQPSDLVWKKEAADWIAASEVRGLFELELNGPPPLPDRPPPMATRRPKAPALKHGQSVRTTDRTHGTSLETSSRQSEGAIHNNSIPKDEKAATSKKKTGLATASLFCGLFAFATSAAVATSAITFLAWLSVSIAGIICGHRARSRIKDKPEEYDGPKRAKAGLIISYFIVAFAITGQIVIGYLRASINAKMLQAFPELMDGL